MQILIKNINGKSITVEADKSETIRSIMNKIPKRMDLDIPEDQQGLMCRKQKLKEHKKLQRYNIKNGAVLTMYSKCKLCANAVSGSDRYCTKFHQRWKEVDDFLNDFKSTHDEFGMGLCKIFLNCESSYKTWNIGSPDIVANSLSDFFEKFGKYLPVFRAILEFADIEQDLQARAEVLANLLPKFKRLRLMDKNGRMFVILCKLLIDRGDIVLLNSLSFELADLDGANSFHKSVFVRDNLKVRAIESEPLELRPEDDTLVYINLRDITDYTGKIKEYARKSGNIPFLFSFPGDRKDIIQFNQHLRKLGAFQKVDTPRSNFFTYIYAPNKKYRSKQMNIDKTLPSVEVSSPK